MNVVERLLDGVDSLLAWLSVSLKQTTASYCDLETADDENTLVAHDGSLVSIIEVIGLTQLLGNTEFEYIREGIALAFQSSMSAGTTPGNARRRPPNKPGHRANSGGGSNAASRRPRHRSQSHATPAATTLHPPAST